MRRLLEKPIFWLLLFALAVRLWGINYGLPQFYISDERAGVYGALKMLELKTLLPVLRQDAFKSILPYLPVPSYMYLVLFLPVLAIKYVLAGLPPLKEFEQALALDPASLFLAARMFIAALGTATVFLCYAIAKRLSGSERAGLFAALFLALSFYHIQLSQVTRHWMPALFFMMLSWQAALRIGKNSSIRPYAESGLWIGTAFGANTAALSGLLIPVFLHFFEAPGNLGERFWSKKLWTMIAIAAALSVFWVALYPYGLTQGETAGGAPMLTIAQKFSHLSEKGLGEGLSFFWYYAKLLFEYETFLFGFGACGTLLMFRRGGLARSWLAAGFLFSAAYLALLYLFFNIIPRGDLFLLPILAVSASFAAEEFSRVPIKHGARTAARIAGMALLGAAFFWPAAIAFQYGRMLNADDSRTVALSWMYDHVPEDQKILADLPTLRIQNTKPGIRALEAAAPSGMRIQDRILLETPDERYPKPSREVLNLHYVPPESPLHKKSASAFAAAGYRYFAVEYSRENMQDLAPQSRALAGESRLVWRASPLRAGILPGDLSGEGRGRALDLSGEIATVRPWELFKFDRFGKFVDVYELPRSVSKTARSAPGY